ncbi:peptidase domain-containing ABC transporter [Prevotella melaninogenica]|uniref:peptidase domain-containing ABC transporter n=1 Tax=Prevotella melaninogenica TaxID=28132 RepID=UPI001C5D670C|nr:peptidase domain-containing ABC transporter [Prevotella melaninogenica]MBW4763335.1 peptidase domain-containing ABC transporter [Prevotella melaninogenica]
MKFPYYNQLDAMDCGPSCLRMVAKYYGKSYTLQTLRERCFLSREGVSMLGISDAAEYIGFRTIGVRISFEQLIEEGNLPCILHWNQNHFVVCYRIKRHKNNEVDLYIADPASKKLIYHKDEFLKCWISQKGNITDTGTALLLEPGPLFNDIDDEKRSSHKDLVFFAKYLLPYKSQFIQLILGMIVGSGIQMIFPFLTQALVDIGIRGRNVSFITLILITQLMLFISQLVVGFIRSWIMLHINSRIDIALISDFLMKLMYLPLHYFDTKMMGDIMQRIGDHGRIKSFLMGTSVNVIFSVFNFIIFNFILGYYNWMILLIFLFGNTLYVIWILAFMKYRRILDIKRFNQSAVEQSKIIQLIQGMQEIKLNNCEKQKRWEWEHIQVKLFKIGVKGLTIGQIQQTGSVFFSQSTSIAISFLAAKAVVDGNMTLGMMMSLTYIIGQVSAPISEFIGFVQSYQDAKISLERLNEVHRKRDEDFNITSKLNYLPEVKNIYFENVTFSYSGAERDYALENITLTIPQHKVTAIVGSSGSGKTTLVKLLQGFYTPNKGNIKIGCTPLKMINPHLWRSKTGSVMQENYIFSDTIAKNIAISTEEIDRERLKHAVQVANIQDFINELPMAYDTKIGMEGSGISQGQRQRILIARAVYKNPEYIFLDEATNSLDANNEKIIMDNLQEFYRGRTVLVVAHRLSTVRNADNIIVLEKGKVVEQGTHEELTVRRGVYYTLVKNQLELGE